MILLEVAHRDSLDEHASKRRQNKISWALQPAMADEQKPTAPIAPQRDNPSATPERLEGLLKEARWKEGLALHEQVYPLLERKGLKELRLICQGLLKDSLKEENLFDRTQAAGALVEQGELSFFGFLEEVRSDQDPMARASAYQEMVEVLGGKGDAMILLSLQKGLSDEEDMVRIQWMEALKRRKTKDSSLLPLLEGALKDRNVAVRSGAAEALGGFRSSLRALPSGEGQPGRPSIREALGHELPGQKGHHGPPPGAFPSR